MNTPYIPYQPSPLRTFLRSLHPKKIIGVADELHLKRQSIYHWVRRGYIPDDRAHQVSALCTSEAQLAELSGWTESAVFARRHAQELI